MALPDLVSFVGGPSKPDGAWLQKLAATAADRQIDVVGQLKGVAAKLGAKLVSAEVAAALDQLLGHLPSSQRKDFLVPKNGTLPAAKSELANPEKECIYLVGNSLGLQPRRTRELVNEELENWARLGVNGHFTGHRPWMPIDENVVGQSAAVVGALPSEVAVMNSLTVNLHLLLISFYRPSGKRRRIMYEADAFGSDFFAFESQVRLHGLEPSEVLLPLKAREGEELLRTEDILQAIEAAGDTLAVLCLGTVQYYTGQYFEVERITKAAQAVGAKALWDCAHAVGNVDLKLHDWGVDGACWCTYKYLNAGPGGIGGFFVHERHHGTGLPLLAGWWGQRKATRFNMRHSWEPEDGASAWRLSNPPVLQTVSLLASLEIFGRTSQAELRGRSMLLTAFLELAVTEQAADAGLQVLTPSEPSQRGCQLSLKFSEEDLCLAVFEGLESRGVVVDHRKPNVLRAAPAPLYNTFDDLFRFSTALAAALKEARQGEPEQKRPRQS